MAEIFPKYFSPLNNSPFYTGVSYVTTDDTITDLSVSYPGAYTFTAPPGVSSVTFELIGAGGSGGNEAGSEPGGGGGAYASRTFSTTPYEEFLFCHGSCSPQWPFQDDGTQTTVIRKKASTNLLTIGPANASSSSVNFKFIAQSYTTGTNPEVITSVSVLLYRILNEGISNDNKYAVIREGSPTGRAIRTSFNNNAALPTDSNTQTYTTFIFPPAYLKPNTQYFIVIDEGYTAGIPPAATTNEFGARHVTGNTYSGGDRWNGDYSNVFTQATGVDLDIIINGFTVSNSDVVMAVGGLRGSGATPGAGGAAADCIGDVTFSGGSGGAEQGGGGTRAGSGGGGAAGSGGNGGDGVVGSGAQGNGAGGTSGGGTYPGGAGGAGGRDLLAGEFGIAPFQGFDGNEPGGGAGGASSQNDLVSTSAGALGGIRITYNGTEYRSNPAMMGIFVP